MLYAIPDTLLKVVLNTKKLVTMLYAIPDTLLEVVFNTNDTGHHVYVIPIVESDIKHQ